MLRQKEVTNDETSSNVFKATNTGVYMKMLTKSYGNTRDTTCVTVMKTYKTG